MAFSRILLYIDSTEASANAALYAILLARDLKARLDGVYVINTKAITELGHVGIFVQEEKDLIASDMETDALRYIDNVEKLARSKGVELHATILKGNVSALVVEQARKLGSELLVLGGLRVIRSRREELSEDSNRIARTATCPVLLVSDDDDVWQDFEER